MITHAPVGRLVKGHVLDVNKKAFERALQAYDHLLYVKWNPNKLRGWGCWEIRRRPQEKSVVARYEFEGNVYTKVDFKEHEDFNHVLDCAFLNYDALRKLKSMDMFNKEHWLWDADYHQAKLLEKEEEKSIETLKYLARYNKRVFREFMNLVQKGMNPAQILTSTKWVYPNN